MSRGLGPRLVGRLVGRPLAGVEVGAGRRAGRMGIRLMLRMRVGDSFLVMCGSVRADTCWMYALGVTYTTSVGVGSPPTQYTLLIDTGSSNTWVGAGKAYVKTSTSKSTGQKVVSILSIAVISTPPLPPHAYADRCYEL